MLKKDRIDDAVSGDKSWSHLSDTGSYHYDSKDIQCDSFNSISDSDSIVSVLTNTIDTFKISENLFETSKMLKNCKFDFHTEFMFALKQWSLSLISIIG